MRRLLLLLLLTCPLFAQHAYWRMNFTQGSTSAISIAEWVFKDGGGSTISTSGGTASASSTVAGTAASAFDSNSGTFWASSGCSSQNGQGTCSQWLQYQFASSVSPVSYTLQTRNDLSFQVPFDANVQFSDDGSSWTTQYLFFGIPGWTANGSTVTLDSTHAAPSSIGISWRISATSNQSGAAALAVAEIKWLDNLSSQYSTTPYAALDSSTVDNTGLGMNAFDGVTASGFWASNAGPSGGTPQWIGYRFASGSTYPASFTIYARNDGSFGQAPVAFKLQSSTDEVTWTDIQSYTAATWTTGSSQTFGVSSAPSPRVSHRVISE